VDFLVFFAALLFGALCAAAMTSTLAALMA
jgi:hypothetical protein